MGQNHCCRKFGPESLGVGSNLSCWTCWTNLVRNFVSVWLLAWRLSGIWIFSLSFVLPFFVWFGYARIFCFLLGLSIVSSMSFCRSRKWCFFFLRNSVQTQALTYTRIHSTLWTHARTPYPYSKPADWVLKLMKSPQALCYWWKRRLPLKEYSALRDTINVKPRVWTLLGVQPPS
jgi:hypothetical protein